ncbi:MAG: GNAT family N-acetyltransferase [Actinomycetota bacterium]
MVTDAIRFHVRPGIENEQLDRLHSEGFDHPVVGYDWVRQLEEHSLTWIGAFRGDRLIGFVNVAWDGGVHAFLLDTAVAFDYRRRGIGSRLVREAIAAVRRCKGIEWLHVDSDEELMSRFYEPAGFERTPAGLVSVSEPPPPSVYSHTSVRRDGDIVVRSAKPWTPAVHALLRHLEDVGFEGAPRVVGSGFDADGNETLTWIEGEVSPEGQRTIAAAAGVGALLRAVHEATASFRPSADALRWRQSWSRGVGDPRVIGHCDNGPWNVVLRDGVPFAFIDWDFAGPIDPVRELAEAAMLNANLYSDDIIEMHGLPPFDYRCKQLRALVDSYGLARKDRTGFIDLMIEHNIRSMDGDTIEANVTPETRESDALWGLTWQARTTAWLLRNRSALERALM